MIARRIVLLFSPIHECIGHIESKKERGLCSLEGAWQAGIDGLKYLD